MVRLGSDAVGVERWLDGATQGSSTPSPAPLSLGVYHHIVTTFDGATLRVYLDGALVGSGAPHATAMRSMATPWTIGGQNCNCSGTAFVGSLDEVAVYGKTLAAERIRAHFEVGRGR